MERNRISCLQSHGKALEKECCLPGVFRDSDINIDINSINNRIAHIYSRLFKDSFFARHRTVALINVKINEGEDLVKISPGSQQHD